jgi:hypothetical protein
VIRTTVLMLVGVACAAHAAAADYVVGTALTVAVKQQLRASHEPPPIQRGWYLSALPKADTPRPAGAALHLLNIEPSTSPPK